MTKLMGTLRAKMKVNTDNIEDIMASLEPNLDFHTYSNGEIEVHASDEYNYFENSFLIEMFDSIKENVYVDEILSFNADFLNAGDVQCKVVLSEGELKIAQGKMVYDDFELLTNY